MNKKPDKATDYVAAWIISHRNDIGGTQLRLIQQDEYGRTFCAEFETPRYFIQFCAWDHAVCLDILVLNKETGGDDYIVAGECNGISGLAERLDAFLHWLNVNAPNQNA